MLYPIVRRQNEILAIGYVAARIIECVFIAGGIIFVLGVVSLRNDSPGAADLAVSLAALKDWTFLFGPGLIVPFGNGLILGYLMYTLRPRPAARGLARNDRRAAPSGRERGRAVRLVGVTSVAILVVPEFVWELFLGIYAAVWGFRKTAPILSARGSMASQTDAAS